MFKKINLKKRFARLNLGSDLLEMYNEFQRTGSFDLILDFNNHIIQGMTILFVSVILGLMVLVIVARGGIAAMFGTLMAGVCVETGQCDFQYLLGVMGFSLVFLTSFALYFFSVIVQSDDVNIITDDPQLYDYSDNQRAALNKIIGLRDVQSLLKLANYLDVPYSTLHTWCDDFEADGLISINRNGSGSPMSIEAL